MLPMTVSAADAWSSLLSYAKREIPEQTFRMWLEPLVPLEFTGERISLGAPDQFSADWLTEKHADVLAALAPIALGYPCEVRFEVNEQSKNRLQMDLFSRTAKHAATIASSTIPPTERPLLSARYTFDNFVIGKSNELAAAASLAVAQAPGRIYNPFVIYGPTGLGKTHLMQAIAHTILDTKPGFRVVFIGAEQFTNAYIAAIQNRSMAVFRARFREVDLLLLDDIHFLKNKEGTQEEFFHTFNALYENGRQIVMTSDRPPAELAGIEARLVTRFQWGLVADVRIPDLEHRVAILRQKAAIDQLERTIPDDVLRFLAENIQGSVRELEGAIVRLLAYASLKHSEVTIPTALEAFGSLFASSGNTITPPRTPSEITVSRIQDVVAQVWGISPSDLRSKSRTRSFVVPRHAAMLLLRELLKLQLVDIGAVFSGRDHSTVIHSLERAQVLLQSDPTFRQHYVTAWEQLTGIPHH